MGQVVYVSLGSNEGDRYANLSAAIEAIEQEVGGIEKISSIYSSPPWGFEADMDFYNLCLKLVTTKAPMELLEKFQAIETKLGRMQKTGKGYFSRNIDIDIISIDTLILKNGQLTVPHPHMAERRFVLEPLFEIAPDYVHPVSGIGIDKLTKECVDVAELTVLAQKIKKNC